MRRASDAPLNTVVGHYVARGYDLRSQTGGSVGLAYPRRFRSTTFILLLLFGVGPGLAYLGWHLSRRDRVLYVYREGALTVIEGEPWTVGRWLSTLPWRARLAILAPALGLLYLTLYVAT